MIFSSMQAPLLTSYTRLITPVKCDLGLVARYQ